MGSNVAEVKFDDSESIAPTLHVEVTVNQNPFAVINPLLDGISAFSTGLVIVKVSDAALLPSARAVFGALALEKSAVLGIPMPKTAMAVHSLISGSPRDIEQYQGICKSQCKYNWRSDQS